MKTVLHALKIINIHTNRISTQYKTILANNTGIVDQLSTLMWFVPTSEHMLYEQLYCVMHDINQMPTCAVCNFPMTFSVGRKQYGKYHRGCSQRDKTVRSKYVDSMITKYGVAAPILNPLIRHKIETTNISKYGVKYFTETETIQTHNRTVANGITSSASKIIHALEYVNDPSWLTLQNQQYSMVTMADNIMVSPSVIQKRLQKFGITPIHHTTSHFEIQVSSALNRLGVSTESRKQINGVEVDIFIPNLSIGIELDGLYWHGENSRTAHHRRYHLNKTTKCADACVKLIHITDYEWIVKQPIVISRLAALVGTASKIHARKCRVVLLSVANRRTFFNTTHLQGDINGTVAYGLMYNDELVSVMSFGRSRYNKLQEWELLRFSTKHNTTVVGGASKLFAHFKLIHNPTSVISYSDKRWGTGDVYGVLNFKWTHDSSPNYFYYKQDYLRKGIHSRVMFQKHKLKHKFEDVDCTMSEWEIMQQQGYNRYWDCGNGVYLWEDT